MTRGKRTRPLLSNSINAHPTSTIAADDDQGAPIDLNDDVDDYVEKRHAHLHEQFADDDSESSADEPEMRERDIMPIDMSDSDSDAAAKPGASVGSDSDGGSDEGDEDDDDDDDPDTDRHDWGVKRKLWYGGDTQDYEIMEDDERDVTLREEEEEAVRLQKKALSALQPEDFRDDDDEDEEGEGVDGIDARAEGSGDEEEEEVSAPEVELLIEEMKRSQQLLKVFEPRLQNESDRILFHLHSNFVSNIIFYLALRTDPEAATVDAKKHPVLLRIVRIRNLLTKAAELPRQESEPEPPQEDAATSGAEPSELPTVNGHEESNIPDASHLNGHADEETVQLNGNHPGEKDSKKKKKKKKRKRSDALESTGTSPTAEPSEHSPDPTPVQAGDDDDIKAFLAVTTEDAPEIDAAQNPSAKRRKLNKLVGAMEREKKNSEGKRQAAADVEFIPAEQKEVMSALPSEDPAITGGLSDDEEPENQASESKTAKKAARKARKQAATMTPHVYTFRDAADPEEKRRASVQVVKNRGLTRHRPRDKKTPRARNRQAYSKALVRRKGAVRDYVGKPGSSYSGEASGINISARKGSKLSTV